MIRTSVSKTEQLKPQFGIGFDVLDEIDTGILLLDANLNVVFVNKAWMESSISMPERNFKPGTPFETIVRAAAEQGIYGSGDIE